VTGEPNEASTAQPRSLQSSLQRTALREDFSWGMLLAVAGGLLVALPAAGRAASQQGSFVLCWLALWGTAVLAVAPAAGALRLLRPLSGSLVALLVAAALAASPLMFFARLLKSATHHRPLGAVTFAVVGAGLLLGSLVIAVRLLALSRAPGRAARWWRAVTICLATLSLVPALRLTFWAFAEPAMQVGLLDAALAVLLVIAAASLRLPQPMVRAAVVLGPTLWLVAVVTAVVILRAAPAVHATLQSTGPVLLGFGDWLAG
jgi:hypothetical protein